ncbi:MAG: hypothetical protein HOV79_08365 [Hamadaea sp.]|nr:hypothetical protein [Hamadaea sp.]
MVSSLLYIRAMAYEEKRAWIMLVVSTVVYAAYVGIILNRADGGPLHDVPYASTLLWSIGVAIVAAIVLGIAAVVTAGKGGDRTDQRDREIDRFGDHVGQGFSVIGAVSAMLMALAEWDTFWIANVIYLGFVLSAILSSIAKIFAYRKGFHPW